MEALLKQIKESPEYSDIAKKLTDSQIKSFLSQYSQLPENQLDSEGGIMITPTKGYVVKTFDISSNEKVFLNICSHEIIDLPEEKDLPDIEDHRALRVPLSLGAPRPDHDRNGKICTIYDIVVNPKILEKSAEDNATRQLLIELCTTHINQKYKQQLSLSNFYSEYRLPKLKYKGTLQQQRVRGKKVIDKEVFSEPVESVRTPSWEIKVNGEEMDVENVKFCREFELVVELELLISGKGIVLQCASDFIQVNVGKIYSLSLWIPFTIDISSVLASFDCKLRKLVITGKSLVLPEETPEKPSINLTPVSLSQNDLLFDVI
jgi:hypothetical protein